ncbi:MAG: DNA glycosylase AlkZ-like family protein, partial [Anaerolineales bacterium]
MMTQKLSPPHITITKPEARRFLLMHHCLWPPRQYKGKDGVIKFIEQVGSIQFDPINIVGRNPDLVLQSRISDYQASFLDQLLYRKRTLIDGWDKMACIYSSSDWPFFTYRREFLRENPDPRKPSQTVLNRTIDQIKKRGPLSSLDFKENKKVDWHWGPTKPVRAAMEYL